MSELAPQEIAAWFRAQAKKFNEMADAVEQTFKLAPSSLSKGGAKSSELSLPRLGTVTAHQLEERVRFRSGRIKDLANHFNVEEGAIQNLIEPNSKVYVAERGWLKVRE